MIERSMTASCAPHGCASFGEDAIAPEVACGVATQNIAESRNAARAPECTSVMGQPQIKELGGPCSGYHLEGVDGDAEQINDPHESDDREVSKSGNNNVEKKMSGSMQAIYGCRPQCFALNWPTKTFRRVLGA
eukprot:973524-Amphidinium_carterae.1